jgi:TRAP transporter TAXI family solute receptor
MLHTQNTPPRRNHHATHMSFDPATLTETLRTRLRRLLKHRALIAALSLLLLIGLVAASVHFFQTAPLTTLAAGPPGGDEARFADLLSKITGRDTWALRIRVTPTAGPADSGAAIDAGKADLAIVRSDLGMPKNGQVVAILRQNVMLLVVPPGEAKGKKKAGKIEKVADLAGRRLGVVSAADTTDAPLTMLMKHYGLARDKVEIVPLAADQVGTAIGNKSVDAILLIAPLASNVLGDVLAASGTAKEQPTIIALQGEAIGKRYPGYKALDLDEGVLGGNPPQPEDDAKTAGFQVLLVARKDVSETKIFDFSKVLYAARAELASAFPGTVKVEAPPTEKDAALTLHPGAAGFLADSYKTFFDRYGDLIFYGLLIGPVLGSALVGAAGFLRADVRRNRTRLINQLLAIITRAREAETAAALDQLQLEADKILRVILHRIATNDLDDDAMDSFMLVLDEVRLAIADRRAALIAAPGKPAAAMVE